MSEMGQAPLSSAALELGQRTVPRRARRRRWWVIRGALLTALATLLFVALRNAPVRDIARVLGGLHLWQIGLLLALDALIFAFVTARWWLVVRAEKPDARFLPMIPVRLSVFGVSYFTLGPQVGGEPLQVMYLQQRHGITYTRATASVVIDKLFELLGNFVLLCFGLAAALHTGVLRSSFRPAPALALPLGLLILWPLVHITLLCFHVYPVSALMSVFRVSRRNRTVRFVRASEHLAGQFCQRHPRSLLGVLAVSILAAVATVSEYALITSFLHIGLPFWALVTAWTSGWLAFLMPLPGGLGALETSQVWTLGMFGVASAAAISVTLVMRGRDLLFGGAGLLLAGNAAWKAGHPKP